MNATTRVMIRLFLAGRSTGADVAATLGSRPAKPLLTEVAEMMGIPIAEGATNPEIYRAVAAGGLDGGETDLSAMTKAELLDYADSEGIEVRKSMTRSEIMAAVEGAMGK